MISNEVLVFAQFTPLLTHLKTKSILGKGWENKQEYCDYCILSCALAAIESPLTYASS